MEEQKGSMRRWKIVEMGGERKISEESRDFRMARSEILARARASTLAKIPISTYVLPTYCTHENAAAIIMVASLVYSTYCQVPGLRKKARDFWKKRITPDHIIFAILY